jgi:glycosyltransferase involved in cell wall biosynthesis
MRISAIVPCYNEEDNVRLFYIRISRALAAYDDYEIIFVDDGSSDETLLTIKRLANSDSRVKYLSLDRNYGLEVASRVGFQYASFEWCVQYDADLQSPPEETCKLVAKALEGYDVVFAVRCSRADPLYRIVASKIQHFIARRLLKIDLSAGASVFRIVKTSLAWKVINYPTRSPYFIATVPLVTSSWTSVPTSHDKRLSGKTKWTVKKLILHSFDLFFGYSDVPLTTLSFMAAVLIAAMGFVLVEGVAGSPTIIWMSMCAVAVFQLIIISVIGAYLRRPLTGIAWHKLAGVKESNIASVTLMSQR